jgi:hypothetical protein
MVFTLIYRNYRNRHEFCNIFFAFFSFFRFRCLRAIPSNLKFSFGNALSRLYLLRDCGVEDVTPALRLPEHLIYGKHFFATIAKSII